MEVYGIYKQVTYCVLENEHASNVQVSIAVPLFAVDYTSIPNAVQRNYKL